MAKFAKKIEGGAPGISTASLPDIVFMLLFFFMVSTTMKEVEYKVDITMPKASEAKKIENKALVSYIYVGPPKESFQAQYGTKAVIQLNDQIGKLENIPRYIEEERAMRNEADVPKMTYSLKIDEECEMGIVTDIKQELRTVQALKVNYSARKTAKKK